MAEHKNITVTIRDNGEKLVYEADSHKDILTVNTIRLSSEAVDGLKAAADMGKISLAEHLEEIPSDYLLFLRAQEPIVCENKTAVTVPHGNAKGIARDGKSAAIAAALDQDSYSFEFFQNASGLELKNFFNAVAVGAEQTGLSLDKAFILMNVRMEDASHIVSPQKYAHAHITDDDHLKSEIKDGRWHVPHSKGALHVEDLELLGGESASDFDVVKVPEEKAESAGHHIVTLSKPWADMLKSGVAEEWGQWRDSWINDSSISQYAQGRGLRIIIEEGVMNFHGGEPLYQGDAPTRWNQAPKYEC